MSDDDNTTYRPSAAIDPARLEYLWTLAERISMSSMVPESLRTEGPANNKKDLPPEVIVANVFAVVEQADRWNQSPFALLSVAAMVHGKLGFEGKAIAAVLESSFGIVLTAYYKGNPLTDQYHIYLCDQELPDDIISDLAPGYRHPRFKIMEGSVAEWKTTGNGSPWRPATFGKMLVYRGTREWTRVYKPSAIMGILGDDELVAIEFERRAQIAKDVTSPSLSGRFSGNGKEGFGAGNTARHLGQGTGPMETIRDNRETVEADKAGKENTQQNSSTSFQRGEDDNAGRDAPPRLPASVFEDYSNALMRYSSAETIEKGHKQFWEKAGKTPGEGPDNVLARLIFKNHVKRANEGLSADDLKSFVAREISASFDL